MTDRYSSSASRRSRRGRRRRRRRRVAVTLIAGLALLSALDAFWAGWTTRSSLLTAQRELECAGEALERGDLELAVACTNVASGAAADAQWFRYHPSVAVGGLLPWIGDDVQAVKALTSATAWAVSGTASLTDAALAAGWRGDGATIVGTNGVVDLVAIERATPGLEGSAADLQQASREIAGIDVDDLLPQLRTAFVDSREALDPRTRLVVAARDLSWILPDMLGAEGVRRYLLAFQNLSAPRGTGGYLGVVGVLEAVNGRISLGSLGPVGDVAVVPPVDVPEDVERRYATLGVDTTMWASNYPPDVPTSSRIAMDIWESAGRPVVDGVVWADTVWMVEMLAATGPVSSSAWPEPLGPDNLIEVLNRQVFETTDTPAANERQTQIGIDLWEHVLAHQPDPTGLAEAMSSGTDGGHFTVYSTDSTTQETLGRLGATGRFELGENPIAVVWQDSSANRAGFFADLAISTVVTLDDEGSAIVRTNVSMQNEAPTGPPSILLGGVTKSGLPAGWWGVDAEVYLPVDAGDPSVKVSEPSVTGVDEAFGHPVVDAFLFSDPGGGSTATVTYRRASAATASEGSWVYTTEIRPQPWLRPIPHDVEIMLPEGATIVDLPVGAVAQGSIVRWSGAPLEPLELTFRYEL